MSKPFERNRLKRRYLYFGIGSYVLIVLFFCHWGHLVQSAPELSGASLALEAVNHLVYRPFQFLPMDAKYLVYGLLIGLIAPLMIQTEYLRRRDLRPAIENGSAKWNENLNDYQKRYISTPLLGTGSLNMIFAQQLYLSMDTRKTLRNNNVMVIGGSGTGKSRFFVMPNLLQANCSFVVTDPSGELLETMGAFLEAEGYEIRVFNLVQMEHSDAYNPFSYIHKQEDVLVMVDALIKNTTPSGSRSSDPFWEKAETALLTAICFYVLTQGKAIHNFAAVMYFLRQAAAEEGETSTLDKVFEAFAKEKFRFDIMRRMGLSTKDVIAPPSFTFKSDYGMVGSVYFRVLFLKTFPQQVQDDLLREITDADCKMVTTLTYRPIDMDSAIKMVKNDIINVNANMIDKQKQASKSGYSVDLINPDLKSAVEEANALLEDLTGRNQKMFFMNMVIVHFADSKKQLDLDTKAIQDIGAGRLVNIQPLTWQQENGLNACLPLCTNKLEIWRTLTTEAAAVFMPFVNQELFDRSGGMYYGINAISRHLIILDRRLRKNGNGLILGSPGSGKSLAAKLEILHVFLSSKDVIIVIDPEGEYYRMAELLGGEVIKIAPGSGIHINPFDNELTIRDDTRDLVTQKSDFLSSIFDSIMGSFSVSPTQHSVIDRCVEICYGPYFASYDASTGTYDKSKVPTLVDFYECLREQPGYEAMQLADALEIYAVGSLDFFAQKTNVEYTKRFVVYDISEISNTMKSFGQLVVLDNIWNRMVSGRKEGRNVWFYIDEVYLLFKSGYSTEFLRNLYKRARKYGGIPTGITQNVTDILKNETARTMIANCEFVQMLSQSADDQAALASILPISPSEMTYITNAPPGQGLIYDGVHIVPFINEVDKNSKIYEAMTTNLAEVKAIEDRKKAEQAGTKSTSSSP